MIETVLDYKIKLEDGSEKSFDLKEKKDIVKLISQLLNGEFKISDEEKHKALKDLRSLARDE